VVTDPLRAKCRRREGSALVDGPGDSTVPEVWNASNRPDAVEFYSSRSVR
jgi:hypothetical protein